MATSSPAPVQNNEGVVEAEMSELLNEHRVGAVVTNGVADPPAPAVSPPPPNLDDEDEDDEEEEGDGGNRRNSSRQPTGPLSRTM